MNPLFLIVRSFIFGLLKMYRWLLSPILPCSCRYLPTCSEYALESLKAYGLIKGTYLTIKRIGKCHPFGDHGYDPIPTKMEKNKYE